MCYDRVHRWVHLVPSSVKIHFFYPNSFGGFEQNDLPFFVEAPTRRAYSCVESEVDVESMAPFSRCKMRVWLMCSAASIVDAISLCSLYLDVCITSNVFRGVVSLRLLRLFTLFRLERKHKFFSPILMVVSNKRTELGATLGIAGLLLLISSTLMYYVESAVNPKFNSILASMWWGTETLTTVGYGDIYPETPMGKAQLSWGCDSTSCTASRR